MFKIIIYWFPPLLWMLVIFFFSSRQRITVVNEYALNFLFFKTLHIIEYATLFILLYRAIRHTSKRKYYVYHLFFSLLLLVLYAMSDEFHQTFVITREGTPRDVIIDVFGGLISWIFIIYILPKTPRKLKNWGEKLEIF
jgi:VanZ family protein